MPELWISLCRSEHHVHVNFHHGCHDKDPEKHMPGLNCRSCRIRVRSSSRDAAVDPLPTSHLLLESSRRCSYWHGFVVLGRDSESAPNRDATSRHRVAVKVAVCRGGKQSLLSRPASCQAWLSKRSFPYPLSHKRSFQSCVLRPTEHTSLGAFYSWGKTGARKGAQLFRLDLGALECLYARNGPLLGGGVSDISSRVSLEWPRG